MSVLKLHTTYMQLLQNFLTIGNLRSVFCISRCIRKWTSHNNPLSNTNNYNFLPNKPIFHCGKYSRKETIQRRKYDALVSIQSLLFQRFLFYWIFYEFTFFLHLFCSKKWLRNSKCYHNFPHFKKFILWTPEILLC